MKKSLLKKLLIILIGLVIGVLMSIGINKDTIFIENTDVNKVKIFINTFTINYWYIFLIWLFSLNEITNVINYLIIILKTTNLGIMLTLLIKSEALMGSFIFLFNILSFVILMYPLMFYLTKKEKSPERKLKVSLLIVCLYSIINALI